MVKGAAMIHIDESDIISCKSPCVPSIGEWMNKKSDQAGTGGSMPKWEGRMWCILASDPNEGGIEL